MKRITNVALQEQCNEEKYQRGIQSNCDPSGMMDWCKCCPFSNGYNCAVKHEERNEKCYCAKAYRKMEKINREMLEEQR